MSDSTLIDLMKTRRTVQSYSTEEVPLQVIREAIEVAAYAPNHRMTFPWRFFLLGSESRARLAEVQVEMKLAKKKNAGPGGGGSSSKSSGESGPAALSSEAQEAMKKKLSEEGTLVIAGIERNSDPDIAREDYASLAMALQNMSLYLWEKGFGSKWGSGKLMKHSLVYELIGRSSEQFEVCALFWIGRASGPIPRGLPRPTVDQIFGVLS